MLPASSWDGLGPDAHLYMPSGRHAWSVMERLRQRHRHGAGATSTGGAEWETIVALAFVAPPADTLDLLDAGGGVLDLRSGDRWDLFFPGYFRSSWSGESGDSRLVLPGELGRHAKRQNHVSTRPAGLGFLGDWYFNAYDFDRLRRDVEYKSGDRFIYDGRPTLVVVRAVFDSAGEPYVDWASLASGPLSDRRHGVRTLSLTEVVHRISTDLERGREDPNWGVGRVTSRENGEPPRRTAATDIGVATAGGALSVWLSHILGL